MERRRTRRRVAAWSMAVAAVLLAACGNAAGHVSHGANAAPGVSAHRIVVGSIANITGPLSSDFAPIVSGVKAYFSMVNAEGGVAGRTLDLAFQTDDNGSPTTDLAVAQKLVQQDGVFAIVGVGTPFFGAADYLAAKGTPTFGYVVSSDWADKPTLFGAYGSVLNYSTVAPNEARIAQDLGATSVGVVAYGVPQSADACEASASGLRALGVNVTYTDVDFTFGADPTADVLQMQQKHVDFLVTCLDVTGNIAFSRALVQNGMHINQLWLNGYDRSTLKQYASLMGGVYIGVEHVPFEAALAFPGVYPGLVTYLRTMEKYQPAATYDEVAMDGWIDAALFVSGLRAAGRELTQAKLVAAINHETAFTADGLTPPVDWTTAHNSHLPPELPLCSAGVKVENGQFVPLSVPGTDEVYSCVDPGSTALVPARAGTPGA